MIARVTGAVVRAFLVVLLIATPSLLLPPVNSDTTQIVALAAIFAAALTLFEYSATYPGLVEFRDAPPFNRIRFGATFLTVLTVTIICRGEADPGPVALFVKAVGLLIGQVLDFPYSPVRLFVLMLPDGADPDKAALLRSTAGLAYLLSIISLAAFSIIIRVRSWPLGNGTFNFWVNLPTFDPTAGGDLLGRLDRSSQINIALGFLLPFLIPAMVKMSVLLFIPITLGAPQTLIWMVTAWAILPASLFMRGIALRRITELIRQQRRRALPEGDTVFQPA